MDHYLAHPPQVIAGYIKFDPLTSSDHSYGVLGRSSCAGGGWRVQRELLEVDGSGHGVMVGLCGVPAWPLRWGGALCE